MLRTILFSLLLCSSISAQEITISKHSQSKTFAHFNQDNYQGSAETFFVDNKVQMGLTDDDIFVMTSESEGRNGYRHYRYKQYHQDIKIYGASYTIHEKNGKVVSANGKILPKIDVDIAPTLSPEQALNFAMDDMGAYLYTWEVENRGPKNQVPTPELVIVDKSVTSFTGSYRLAYEIEIHSIQPLDANIYLIDAHTGVVIKKITKHQSNGVPGRGVTKYYGVQDITVDSIGPNRYELHDPTRGENGINVTDESLDNFRSDSNFFDLTNEEQNEVAVDALYLSAELYDELIEEFDWVGLDNNNRSFNVIVHANDGEDFINAFWDGQFAHFGNGDCNHGPLTTYEVLAHEFMHGIIDFTSELIYADESGAINESMADVLGQYMEWIGDRDNFSWELGHSFQLVENLPQFRVMDDPNSVDDPAFYRGDFWIDGANVHINSAIGNLFYVLLSDGGSGLANNEVPYSVDGIGKEEAAKFIFYVNRMYLTESSGYNDYYNVSIEAAEEFFDGNTAIIEDINQAWAAVGLPTGGAPSGDETRLSVATNGFATACGFGIYEPLDVTVTNEGDTPYLESQGASVVVERNGAEVGRVPLDFDIEPGTSLQMTLDSVVFLDDDFIFVDVQLEGLQNNTGTDSDLAIFIVREFENDDLELIFSVETPECFSDGVDVSFRARNNSCFPIDGGTPFDVTMTDENGEILYTETLLLNNRLNAGASRTFDRTLDLALDGTMNVEVRLDYDADPSMDNNIDSEEIRQLQPIELGYLNEFQDFSDVDRGISIESLGDDLTRYQNNNLFYATGSTSLVDQPLCLEAERNFEGELSFFGSLTAIIRGCVDATGLESPALSFDMVQFRNDATDFRSEASASAQVLLNNDNEEVIFSEIIQGQSEGEFVNHIISLPSDYKGAVDLKFVTQSGTFQFDPEFLDFDVVMLDNLSLTQVTSTDDVNEINDFTVFPNPASDHIHIGSEVNLSRLKVIDTQGRIIIDVPNPDSELNVSLLEKGFYIISATDESSKEYKSSFTKL